jgi:hypothetical protein
MINDIRFYRATGEFGFLSNLYPAKIVFEGIDFPSSEHAYQFGKFKDRKIAEWAMTAPKPHLIAILAHNLFVWDIVENWSAIKLTRMEAILEAKFTQHSDLRSKLLATQDKMLIEESTTDAFWGIGKKGMGKNMLGILLMKIRKQMQEIQ